MLVGKNDQRASFKEIIEEISDEWRKLMKKECGGLQTLLKNNKQLFVVEKEELKKIRISAPDSLNPI